MTDSNSFSSLLALVDSHLSKCNLQTNENTALPKSIPIPGLNGIQKGLSDSRLGSPSQIGPLPAFNASNSPISNILAEQVSNMLKAKEKKHQREYEEFDMNIIHPNLSEDNNLVEDEDMIDLVKAVKEQPYHCTPMQEKEESQGDSSEFGQYGKNLIIDDVPNDNLLIINPILSKTDMSCILKHKVKMGKCSSFGKVLCARLRPVAAPYIHQKVVTNIKRFYFNTKSPCDIISERLKKTTTYSILDYLQLGEFEAEQTVSI